MRAPTPTLLIPGLNCSARAYAHQIPVLWRFGPVTVADHRRGGSMAEIAAAILDFAPPRFVLCGFSMGGYIALEVMHQARDRVLGLIMIDSSARPDTPEQSEQRRKRIASAQAGDFKSVVDDQFPQLVHPDNSRNETLAALNMAMAEDCGAGAFIRHQEAIIQRPDSRPDLAAITCPTLILVGDSDRVTPPELSQEMADGITDARLEIIPGAGHLSLLEQPDAVNRALISWLDTALPDGQS